MGWTAWMSTAVSKPDMTHWQSRPRRCHGAMASAGVLLLSIACLLYRCHSYINIFLYIDIHAGEPAIIYAIIWWHIVYYYIHIYILLRHITYMVDIHITYIIEELHYSMPYSRCYMPGCCHIHELHVIHAIYILHGILHAMLLLVASAMLLRYARYSSAIEEGACHCLAY